MKKTVSVLALIVLLVGPAFAESGQQCSNRTNTGKYVTVCDGFLTPAPGAPLVPAKLLGVAIVDRYGNITGDGTVSIGGMIVQQTVQGTETVNPDCSGSITYQTWINGQPGPPLQYAPAASILVQVPGDGVYSVVTYNLRLRKPDLQSGGWGGSGF